MPICNQHFALICSFWRQNNFKMDLLKNKTNIESPVKKECRENNYCYTVCTVAYKKWYKSNSESHNGYILIHIYFYQRCNKSFYVSIAKKEASLHHFSYILLAALTELQSVVNYGRRGEKKTATQHNSGNQVNECNFFGL